MDEQKLRNNIKAMTVDVQEGLVDTNQATEELMKIVKQYMQKDDITVSASFSDGKGYVEHYDSMGSVTDGFHTFDELYNFRMLYNAMLFNLWGNMGAGVYDVHKSHKHSDGELAFGGEWFVVVAELPTGQITNHYENKHWDLFKIPERNKANKWDGHTPADVADRLYKLLTNA